MSESSMEAVRKQSAKMRTALRRWKNLLALFSIRTDADPSYVLELVRGMPQPLIERFQMALMGSGCCTEKLYDDGDVGQETVNSVVKLFETAGRPDQSS